MTEDSEHGRYARLVAYLREEFGADLLGVLVTGSRVYGTAGPTSDLDAHVIIATPQRQRRNFVLNGIEVELFINPVAQIRRYFADGRGHDPHMFTFGRAIYDPHGTVAALQAEAQRIWAAGPPGLEPHMYWLHRYFPADLLRDLDDVGDADEATATLLLAAIVERLLATHHAIQRRWQAKPKRRLAELAVWDLEAAQLARLALAGVALAERCNAAKQLADHILRPLGGLMPLEWCTAWEVVSEA